MSPQYFDQFDLPAELCTKPLALIGLTGLDTVNNAIHKTIWDAFSSNRRVERSPVTFKLLSNAHEFPVIKPKRNLYEWYIPKGILKRNWMNKHLNELPAVIVIFYDLDWNDAQWNEKMIECSSRVQSMRAAVEGRNTRITVVLIQQTLPLPAGEDVLAAERAAALCASCELNTKSLFVLPLGDHLQGYTVRLETAFYDLAQNYYHHEARNVKSHRELLNKTTHQYLFVRHQFKMGFLNELKQDSHTAHKHYMHAYNNLLELRIVDTNALEIKTVAGFINYKLCRLNFVLNLPRDAISQFRGHIDRFKSRVGFRELAFEHYAWLAKQFTIFGDIFDEAVKLGLPAVQTQHPGFYYQQAAQYGIQRKQACQELCQDVKEYPSPDPLTGLEGMEFYGQRPWRPGKLSAEPPDPQKEQNGIQALQFLEKQVNHSNIIISYYGLAISQFKTYRCPRMRRHLVVQMADEYFNSKDYGKALTLLTHMLWDYRSEKWWSLISDILQKALNCAYLSANIQDYVTLSLEILGGHIMIPHSDKSIVFRNLNNVLKKFVPEPEKNLPESEIMKAATLWKTAISSEPMLVSVDMNNITSCVDCKARFTQNKYEADQNVTVEVFIRSTCPHPLNFSYLSVTVNTPNYSSEFAVNEQQAGNINQNPSLHFESYQTKRFLVDFLPDLQDVGQEIQIGSILLHLGNKNERCVLMRFTGTGCNNRNYPELLHFRHVPHNIPNFDNIKSLSSALIVHRIARAQVDVSHDQPALVGEWYPVHISVTNTEQVAIRSVQANITLEIDEIESELAKIYTNTNVKESHMVATSDYTYLLNDNFVVSFKFTSLFSTHFCVYHLTNISNNTAEFSSTSSGKPNQLPLNLKLPDLNVKDVAKTEFYMRSHRTGDRNVTLRISYLFTAEKSVESINDEVINIPVTRPFDVTSQYFSARFEPISKMYVEEMFIVMPQIKCISPWPIIIDNTVFEFNVQIKSLSSMDSQLAKTQLQNEEMGAEVFAAEVGTASEQPISIGHYMIYWSRVGSTVLNSTQISIKGLSVDEVPLRIESVLPAHGFVRTPMSVTYELHNRSVQLLQFDLTMDASESFMFAGYKQIQVSILPKSVKVLKYNMYPLVPGNVALPKLKLAVNEKNTELCFISQQQLSDLLDRCVPTHVYIMPQVKGNPETPSYADIMKLMQ